MSVSTEVLGLLGAIVIAAALWRLLRPEPRPSHLQQAVCPTCGWKGTVSRFAGRCPACNAAIGEQRARRR
jgi:hypothetical protein